MDESMDENEIPQTINRPKYLEVACKSSGEVRRFAAGTDAGFAVSLINHKLQLNASEAIYIEAVKEGEEPICFGPNAALVNYGQGWTLQTVIKEGRREVDEVRHKTDPYRDMLRPAEKPAADSRNDNLLFIGKILVAFAFMFLIGGFLTLFLEFVPTVLLSESL